jgi:hypothetical protein
MNIAEKMERESRLMGNIADWMEKPKKFKKYQ